MTSAQVTKGFTKRLTAFSLLGLAVGLTLGGLLRGAGNPLGNALTAVATPIGQLWVTAVQMTVLPLVVTQLLVAIVDQRSARALAGLGGRAVALFVAMLALMGIVAVLVMPLPLSWFSVSPEQAEALRASVLVPQDVKDAANLKLGPWWSGLLPRNVIQAAASGEVLPLLIFTMLLGGALLQIDRDDLEVVARVIRGVADAIMIMVTWVLRATPLGVLALALVVGRTAGGTAVQVLAAFVVMVCGLMLAGTLLLYPVATLLGRVRLTDFARAVLPAQIVAVSTRSSLAALPALVEGGRSALRLPEQITGFVLPLSTSLFKINRMVSSPFKLLFLAHVFGVTLSAATIAMFLLTVLIMSFTSVGIPGGGGNLRSLPAYLAAGVPIEGVVLVEAVDAIPDIFKTLMNVTGDMTAATLLANGERRT